MKAALLYLLLLASLPCIAQVPLVNDEPITPPTVIYPAGAKAQRIQGTVELEVRVSETGQVAAVRALSGPDELRQAAIDAYKLASYRPLLRAGKPIPAVIHTKVDFSLHEAPPTPDDLVAKEFEPIHQQCQTLARANDPAALATCRQALDLAGRFTPTGHMVAHAAAYNDVAMTLLAQGKPKEAALIGDEAVLRIADAYPGSLAAANAYLTRAETRSRNKELQGSIADCTEAERILRGLIDQATAPYLAQDMKAQLRGVLRLHAVVLRKNFKGGKAKALEDEADKM